MDDIPYLENNVWVIRIIFICTILFLSWFIPWKFTAITPTDVNEIQKLILDSVATEQTAIILPEPYRLNLNTSIPEQVKKEADKNIEDKLSKFYSPNSKIYRKMVERTEALINAQETGHYRFSGGGVSKYKNIKLTGQGNVAAVSADIWVWNKAFINNTIAHPEIGEHYQFSVVREGNKWMINNVNMNVIPGEGA